MGRGSETFNNPKMVTRNKDLREEKEPTVERPGKVSQGDRARKRQLGFQAPLMQGWVSRHHSRF